MLDQTGFTEQSIYAAIFCELTWLLARRHRRLRCEITQIDFSPPDWWLRLTENEEPYTLDCPSFQIVDTRRVALYPFDRADLRHSFYHVDLPRVVCDTAFGSLVIEPTQSRLGWSIDNDSESICAALQTVCYAFNTPLVNDSPLIRDRFVGQFDEFDF